MNFDAKFLIDYHTFFINHTLVSSFHNCLLLLPYSNYIIANDLIMDILNSEQYSNEEKETIFNKFKPIMGTIEQNSTIIDEIENQNKLVSSAICINALEGLYLALTASFDNENLQFTEKTLEDLDIFDFDALSASEHFKCPLFTTNQELVDIIEENNLPIQYIIPEI